MKLVLLPAWGIWSHLTRDPQANLWHHDLYPVSMTTWSTHTHTQRNPHESLKQETWSCRRRSVPQQVRRDVWETARCFVFDNVSCCSLELLDCIDLYRCWWFITLMCISHFGCRLRRGDTWAAERLQRDSNRERLSQNFRLKVCALMCFNIHL